MLNNEYLIREYDKVLKKYPYEFEYQQAVLEMLESIDIIIDQYPHFIKENIIGRLLEPERIISFRVAWMNQNGETEVNTGFRVQYNSVIGIYKGGIRFHPSVNQSILKFLAFEQTFKNALTTLPMGGGKGGSDFDPKGRSDEDVMRFCQAFISELFHHISEDLDIPAGDIGVGRREIGYMYGYYKKLKKEISSVFTGKHVSYGGSLVRKEATGFGLVYFVEEALKTIHNTDLKNKKVIVSGSGNVAIYTAYKVIELGGIVIGMSDSKGYIYSPNGIAIEHVKEIKEINRESLELYTSYDVEAIYKENPKGLWSIACDIALPCATQNELDIDDVEQLIDHGVMMVAEGANMPTTKKAIALLKQHKILFGPAKAANAGGVLVSGLEISQNSQFYNYSFEKVDKILSDIMRKIFHDIYAVSKRYNQGYDLLFGANIHSFKRIAKAIHEQGVI